MATAGARTQRVTLGLLMLVVAAVAFGIVWTGAYFQWLTNYAARGGMPSQFLPRLQFYVPAAFPGLMMATLALMLLHLIPPRLPARELLRSPGAAACVIVTSFLLLHVACLVMGLAAHRFSLAGAGNLRFQGVLASIVGGLHPVGLAVGGAWLVQWASRMWDGEWSWMEWVGRLLGACWIAAYVFLIGVGYLL